jgi:imidazolonepropionase-like amidohydrolase
MVKLLIFAIVIFSAFSLSGQQQDPPPTVIKASQMLDVRTGKLLSNAVIVIQGDKISAVNPPGEFPPNATVIDLGNLTLLPGLIDTHTHLTYDADNYWLDIGRQSTSYAVAYALVGAKNARITLLAGFTTVRDLGACCLADIHLMRAIEKNLVDGPSIFPSGNIIATTGSACDQSRADPTVTAPGPEQGIGDDIDSLVKAVRTQLRFGARVIKVCADQNTLSQEELNAIAQTTHQRRAKLAVHVWEEESVKKGINAGADSIEHTGIMSEGVINQLVEKGIYLVPTMYTNDTFDLSQLRPEVRSVVEKDFPKFEESFRLALKKGVKMAFGSDSGQIPHGDNAKEFVALVKRGMPPLQAIQSATINAADLLTLTDRAEIKEKLRADLIAIEGNPLQDITVLERPVFVMKGGKIYKRP